MNAHRLSRALTLAALSSSPAIAHADPPSPAAAPAAAAGPSALAAGQHFSLDPVSDGVLTASGFGFSLLLGAVLGTGEIAPPLPAVSASSLLSFDRTAVSQKIDPNAGTYSNVGLYGAIGYAVVDSALEMFRDGPDAMLVDAFMYAESGSLALALTDVMKIAVRRPRPIDYINCGATATPQQIADNCKSTDLGLSFWSGHASAVASMGATATYIAFVRDPHSPRPWITLGAATALTAFVSYERVRAGDHFPTDVIAGSLAGATIGVLVPHLHRHAQEAPPVWIGAAPTPGGGGLLTLGGVL